MKRGLERPLPYPHLSSQKWKLCAPEYRGMRVRRYTGADGRVSFGVSPEMTRTSWWPSGLARPVSVSHHAFYALEENAWAVRVANGLSHRAARKVAKKVKKKGGTRMDKDGQERRTANRQEASGAASSQEEHGERGLRA